MGNHAGQFRFKFIRFIAAFIAVIILGGCVVPTGKTAKRGQIYSSDSLEFLNGKNTTRSEVVSTLGLPYFESTNSHVMVYLSETYTRWQGVVLEPDFDENLNLVYRPESITDGRTNERMQALYVAFDSEDLVQSYTLRKISGQALNYQRLEELCQRHAMQAAKPPP